MLSLILAVLNFALAQSDYPYAGRTLLLSGEEMQTGVRYSMNDHFITLNPDGNFVIARSDGGYVWGFDTQGIDYQRVAKAIFQQDGNFAVYDANGGYIWSMLTANPDPQARLILTPNGVLQLYSDTRGILWASDGNLTANVVTTTPGSTSDTIPSDSACVASSQATFPLTPGTVLERGVKYPSASGNHYLIFAEQDGNLIVRAALNDQYIWGTNQITDRYNQTARVEVTADGNLTLYDTDSGIIWSALASNTNPSACLKLTFGGALQLVSDAGGILWSSDGNLTSAMNVATITDAVASPCPAEPGWPRCLVMKDPQITIRGSSRVSDFAMNAAANIYTDIASRLEPGYPKNDFDGFRVYITNGESHDELKTLSTVGSMWTDGYDSMSRNFLRGGAAGDVYLWISEQMICKQGVQTRNEDYTAGRHPSPDNNIRTFDQLIHEFGHNIDAMYNLRDRINRTFQNDPIGPVEAFPWAIQHWFGAPSGNLPEVERAFMDDLFTSRTTFSCEGYQP
jgi:hypothetical protein